ncbi:hypothetical protein SO694_00127073 [Aureococcus anophagefferens]|uniref:Uncharacterized protein n=1 Tax=Aureococcus anophagefferens TaxID=44056 RepID=A0ABR1G3J0_AURAN
MSPLYVNHRCAPETRARVTRRPRLVDRRSDSVNLAHELVHSNWPKGCQLRAGSLLSSRKVCEVECGARARVETVKRVVAGDREVERCEIVLPVKGWCRSGSCGARTRTRAGAAAEEPWPAGAKVRLEGLAGAPDLEGKSAVVREAPAAAGGDERVVALGGRLPRCAGGRARVPRARAGGRRARLRGRGRGRGRGGDALREDAALVRRHEHGRNGPVPAPPAGARAWAHHGDVKGRYFRALEAAEAADAERRAADAEAEARARRGRGRGRGGGAADGAPRAAGRVADDAAPTARTALAKGTLVIVKGLTRLADLNGRSGVRARDKLPKGDEVVFVTEEEAREGMYAVKLDPQFYYDKAIDASSPRRTIHPDKNRHPQAGERRVPKTRRAFETLSDPKEQRKLLVALGVEKETSPFAWTADDDAAFADDDDDDDQQFQWWWEASPAGQPGAMAMEDPAREEAPVAAEGAPVATEEARGAGQFLCAPEAPTDGDAPKSPLQGMMASMICCSTERRARRAEPEPEPAPEPEVAAAPEPEAAPEAPPPAPARRSSMAPKPAPPKKRLSVAWALQASVAAALGAAEDTEEAVVLEAVLQKKGSGARPSAPSGRSDFKGAVLLDGCGVAAAAKRGGAAHVFEASTLVVQLPVSFNVLCTACGVVVVGAARSLEPLRSGAPAAAGGPPARRSDDAVTLSAGDAARFRLVGSGALVGRTRSSRSSGARCSTRS